MISRPSRAIVRYGRKPFIHHLSATRASLSPSFISIAYPLRVRRDLSSSPSSSSQAAAAAQDSSIDRNPSQTQGATQRRPNQYQPQRGTNRFSSDGKLNDVHGLLDMMYMDRDSRSETAARRSSMDKQQGDEVSQLLHMPRGNVSKQYRSYLPALAGRNLSAATHGPELNLGPRLGRSIPVRGKDGLKDALSFLGKRVAQNRVKQDKMQQKFHVRRGKLKKDLKSMRWRRLFKKSFQATVDRCEKLRRQGW